MAPMMTTRLGYRLRFILLALWIIVAGCAHGFEDGTEALAAGDTSTAETIADDELADDPDSPWGHQLKAEVLADRGEHRQALPHARSAVESEAFPERAPRLLAEIYLAIGQPVDAALAFEHAREANPDSVDDDTFIHALERGHDYARSRSAQRERWEMISRLAEIAPDHPDATAKDVAVARRAYAIDLRRQGEYLEAIDLLRTALDDDPEVLRGEALDLGEMYARLDMPDQAREAWDVYLAEDVDHRERDQRHRDVAQAAARHNLTTVAVDVMEELVDDIDDDHARTEALLDTAYYQLRAGQRPEARQTVFEYLDSSTSGADDGEASSVPFHRAAELARDANDIRLAIMVLERGIEEAVPNRSLTRMLADIFARRAQFDRVQQTMELFISRHDRPTEAMLFAGQWARERNNYDLARTFLERAVDSDDPPTVAWHRLAHVLGELEEYDEMTRTLNAYVDRRDGDDDALSTAARTFADHRLYDEAEYLLERLHSRRPHSRSVTRQFAGLYRDWARPADAADVWDRWIRARGDDPDDMTSVASVLARNEDYERASQFYARAAEAGKVDAWLDAADIHLRQQHHSAMVRALEAYVDDYPNRIEALEEAASRYRRAGMEARKIDALTELVELRPDSWPFHEALTGLLLEQGRYGEAFDHLHRFVERSPDPVRALDRLSSPIASTYPSSWLLDFYQSWRDEEAVHPAILRHIGDAFYALSYDDALSDESKHDARRQARSHYMEFLDEAEDTNEDWNRLADNWRRKEMWRPAAIAYERHAAQSRRHNVYSRAYAEVLLNLGEPERATEVLERHFQNEQRRPDIAWRIAQLLIEFNLYDEAETFAAHNFLSGDDNNIERGFRLLAEILNQREDMPALGELADDYIDRASNTRRARRAAISLLEDAGQWERAADHLHQMEMSALSQHAIELGFHHYHSGKRDRAWSAFEEASHHAPNAEFTWRQAGEFLAARGERDVAADAFDLAIQANPDDLDARTSRGLFAIRYGDVETGWHDYDFGRNATDPLSTSQRDDFFNAFVEAGRFDLANRVFEDTDADGLTPSGSVQQHYGHWRLRDANGSGVDDAVDGIRAGTWGIYDTVDELHSAGRFDIGLDLIEEEFEEGDPTTAAILLLNHSTTMARLVDWDTQSRWLRAVVDPLERSDTGLVGPVGDHRARSGQHDEARIYLQSAVDHDDELYSTQLGHVLLLSGERDAAIRKFEAWLLDKQTDSRALESILLRFELVGDDEGARRFLSRVADEPSLIDIVLPYKTHYALEHHGDPDRAIADLLEMLTRMERAPASAFRDSSTARSAPGLSRDELIASSLVGSLQAVAALGYVNTVEDAIANSDDLPAVGPHHLYPLRLHLALANGDVDTATDWADELLDTAAGTRELQQRRLELARTFLSFGAAEQAADLVDDALDEQTDFRSHGPFTLHLGLLTLDDDPDLDGAIDAYLSRVPNRRDARMAIIDELQRLGRDTEALRLARQAVEVRPTTSNLRTTLHSAIDDGDRDTVEEMATLILQIDDTPVDTLSRVVAGRRLGTEPELLLPLVEAIRSTRPADLEWIVEYARLLYIDGSIEEARTLVVDALDEREHHRDAVMVVAEMLSEEHLDVELSRVVAPRVPDEELWPGLIIAFAEADFALGFDDDALQWLDRLDDDPQGGALWRIELAHRLADRQLFDAIGLTLDAVERDRVGPFVDYLTGLHQLASGDSEVGVETLRRSNIDGVDRIRTHYHGIRAALVADDTEATLALMDDLTEVAPRDADIASISLRMLLSSAMPMDSGPEAIRLFLEDRLPRLVDGHGATWTQFAGLLAKSFEETGDPEGSYGFYRDRVWKALLYRDADSLPIYLNNLAYTYSTTNRHIDRGMDKIRRSIVLHRTRSASLIDTLGWLYYRQGDLEAAEREVRRALRSHDGRHTGLDEILHHLQVILDERGAARDATWIDVRRNRLPPDTLGW